MNANLYAFLASRFPSDRAKPCLITDNGRTWTYADLDRASARLANLLAGLKLAPGDRVAVQVEKSAEALALYLATLRAGLVFLPLNTAYQRAEVGYFIEDATPAVVVCSPASLGWVTELARGAGTKHVFTLDEQGSGTLSEAARGVPESFTTVESKPGDLAVILYTSGTTGRSKGAMITHANLVSNATTLVEFWGFRADDVLLHMLPIFHIHGLFVACHTILAAGGSMLFHAKFDAKRALHHLPEATVFMGVPTFYTRLLAQPEFGPRHCRNLRLLISGSAPLLAETFNEFRRRTRQTILERYGMTETGMNTSNPLNGERIAGTVGRPLPGVSVRVVDAKDQPVPAETIGSVQVKGPNVFAGYWRMPEKTQEEFTRDGWFRTGDMGKFGTNGYLTIVGRSKDLIITGGLNVYPKEIESIIDELPGVAESAVIGVPHPDFGEAVTAVVVRGEGGEALSEAAVIDAVKGRLAAFKVPKRVHFVAELPRNAMGKVQKNILREAYKG